ncbi:hypothetical protein [Sphingomonas sp. R86521]|uniref:hypothetical protein n=1 Tax=Sphingomonas sp. R86521 TaxID=3093860 RepID=UPI0036D21F2F
MNASEVRQVMPYRVSARPVRTPATTRAVVAIPFNYAGDMPDLAGSFEGIEVRSRIDTGAGGELAISSPFAHSSSTRATIAAIIEML